MQSNISPMSTTMDDAHYSSYNYFDCNCTNLNYTACTCLSTTQQQTAVDILFYILIWSLWFITIAGNVLTITVFIRDPQLRSKPANLLILNLCIADLLIGVNSLTFTNLKIHFDDFWIFGEVMCKIYQILDFSASTQSAFAITLISFDRLLLVTTGVQYKKYMTAFRAKIGIGLSWFIAFNLFFIPILVSDYVIERWVETYSGIWGDCDFAILYEQWYKIFLLVVTFIIPLLLLIVFNSIVYHNVRMRSIGQTRHGSCKMGTSLSSSQNNRGSSDFKKHRKAAITLAVIVVTFVFCWIPLWIKEFITDFLNHLESDFWLFNTDACAYLSWSNSAVNPFLYAATNPRIRAGLSALLCCSRRPSYGASRYWDLYCIDFTPCKVVWFSFY